MSEKIKYKKKEPRNKRAAMPGDGGTSRKVDERRNKRRRKAAGQWLTHESGHTLFVVLQDGNEGVESAFNLGLVLRCEHGVAL